MHAKPKGVAYILAMSMVSRTLQSPLCARQGEMDCRHDFVKIPRKIVRMLFYTVHFHYHQRNSTTAIVIFMLRDGPHVAPLILEEAFAARAAGGG